MSGALTAASSAPSARSVWCPFCGMHLVRPGEGCALVVPVAARVYEPDEVELARQALEDAERAWRALP